jgi:opacity protein-like surface antigen
MSKRTLLLGITLLLLPAVGMAQGVSLGVGASAGLNIPLVQDDQANGTAFGFRGMVGLMSFVRFEPNISFAKYGDPSIDEPGITSDLEGSKLTSYGVDAVLGAPMGTPGLAPFGLVGAGFYKAKRDQTQQFDSDETDFGWRFGLGLGLGLPSGLGLDVRGVMNLIPVDGGSSKKTIFAQAGLNYVFGGK